MRNGCQPFGISHTHTLISELIFAYVPWEFTLGWRKKKMESNSQAKTPCQRHLVKDKSYVIKGSLAGISHLKVSRGLQPGYPWGPAGWIWRWWCWHRWSYLLSGYCGFASQSSRCADRGASGRTGAGPATPGYDGWRHSGQTPQCAVKKTKTGVHLRLKSNIFFPTLSMHGIHSWKVGKKGLSVSYYHSVCQEFVLEPAPTLLESSVCVAWVFRRQRVRGMSGLSAQPAFC